MGDADQAGDAARMRLRVLEYAVADPGRRLGRILTPAAPLRNTRVYPLRNHWGSIWSSRADILRLGALVRLAATAPHSVVYVPAPPDAAERPFADQVPTALVVARDDVGLRASDWPRLRARMHHGPVPGTPRTVRTPAPRPRSDWTDERGRRAAAHPYRTAENAGTWFLLGHRTSLFDLGDELTACAGEIAGNSDVHRHGEAYLGDVLPDVGLIAVEPIFHRRRWQPAAARRTFADF